MIGFMGVICRAEQNRRNGLLISLARMVFQHGELRRLPHSAVQFASYWLTEQFKVHPSRWWPSHHWVDGS
jgi:hypothetical protein